jgi:putative glutamine amidotransferase
MTTRLELETRRFYLGRDYSEAVAAAGGIPVQIPLIPERQYIESVVGGLDGILLPGSDTDVDPARFGEEPHPKLKKVIPEKDATDLMVLEEVEKLNLPVLAICYGMQALNVSRGGTLIQDIGSKGSGILKHEQGMPLDRESHSIEIAGDSLLSDIAGQSGRWRVNSHHHQAVAKLGRELKAIAWADDGIVEAIQDSRSGTFILGVQWHPELCWNSDRVSRRIFESFVSRCASRKAAAADGIVGNDAADRFAGETRFDVKASLSFGSDKLR